MLDERDTNVEACEVEGCKVKACEVDDDECIPECDETIKPYIEQRFETVNEGVHFYKEYVALVGFDVRNSTMKRTRDGDVGVKYLLCSREGYTVNRNQGSKSTTEDSTTNINTCPTRLS